MELVEDVVSFTIIRILKKKMKFDPKEKEDGR